MNNIKLCSYRWILVCAILVSPSVYAQRGGGGGSDHSGVMRKQEAKVKTRWTLSEWLDQKKRNGLMDQWLAIHTSDNPYEFFLGGERLEQDVPLPNDPETNEKYMFNRARAGAYASIIGIEGGYDFQSKGWSAWDASLNLRILGTAYQNTNLTLKGGAKGYSYDDTSTPEDEYERWQLPFAGVQLTFYLNRYFGVQGEYWYLFSEKSNRERRLRGENSRALLFIDFMWLRLYGGWGKDYLVFSDEQTNRRGENRNGIFGGLTVFF